MSANVAAQPPLPAAPVALAGGDEMPESTSDPLTRTDFVRYAGAGGDFNPIHHDEELAHRAGQPSVFGMGMLHAGMLGIRLARWVGPTNLLGFALRFTGQVWPGDVLTFSGRVVQVEKSPDGPQADLELAVTRQGGDVVLTATAVALVAAAE